MSDRMHIQSVVAESTHHTCTPALFNHRCAAPPETNPIACAQASRVKFVFGPEALKVVIGEEQEEFENAFVGGANEWKYETFTNWEFWCAINVFCGC